MYVLSASAQAADRNEKVFQIRKLHKKENTAIYVIKITYAPTTANDITFLFTFANCISFPPFFDILATLEC